VVTPGAKREAVAHLVKSHEVSERRACRVLSVDRSSVRYVSRRPPDTELRAALRKVASQRRRFGYRRLHVMLRREGIEMNLKKLRRLYREEGLQVRKRGGRKRALGSRRPMEVPARPYQRWSLDFVSDAFTDGRRFRVLAVVDDFTRQCLALVADTSLSGHRLVRELGEFNPPLWQAGNNCLGQWNRDDQYGRAEVVRGSSCTMALHRPRQTHAKRFCGKL